MSTLEVERVAEQGGSTSWRWQSASVGLLMSMIVAFVVDVPVAKFCKQTAAMQKTGLVRTVDDFLENAETFGHGVGAGMILIGVLAVDPAARKRVLYLLAGTYGAGLVANVVKLTIVRSRPRFLVDIPVSVWSTFGGFFSKVQSNDTQSFPSAHTATAVGLAVMLGGYYPHARWYFTGMAILVGLQRIHTESHFPSDVFAGALLGWGVASACRSLEVRSSEPIGDA